MAAPPDPLSESTYMRRAIRLAMNGRGSVEPNPMVGCVIVADSQIIGEGYHRRFGGPHAEREALAACTQPPAGATAYVTLEPCCHTHKKTPPCVPALIQASLARVVVGCTDPNPAVCSQGLLQLRNAGISVDSGLVEPAARQLSAPFFARILHNRPYVTLKWAQSPDGKVAGPGGQRTQISNPTSTRLVHQLRARSDAILIGVTTARIDDPLLTPRDIQPARRLLRCILDTRLRLSPQSQLARTARDWPLAVYCTWQGYARERAKPLEALGAEVVIFPADPAGRPSLPALMADLRRRDVTHLLVEGGPTVARSFLEQNLADRIWVFHGAQPIGSPTAPDAPSAAMPVVGELELAGDRLVEMLNPASPVFFEASPSADFVLASETPASPAA